MTKEIYAQGSIPEFMYDGDNDDRNYLPARSTSFGINRKGAVVFLPDNSAVSQYATQLNGILKDIDVSPPDSIMIPDADYLLDIAVSQFSGELQKHLFPDEKYVVWPYANTGPLRRWVRNLNNEGFQVNIGLPAKIYFDDLKNPQHRGGWGRWVDNPDELSFPEKYDIPYPVSYLGQGVDQVVEAYKRVCETTNNPDTFFKPVFSAGGFSLAQVSSVEEVRAHHQHLKETGGIELFEQEMPVEIQEKVQVKALISTQYTDGRIVTPSVFTRQLENGNNWAGNMFNGSLNGPLVPQVENIFDNFQHGIHKETGSRLLGMGGLDGAIVEYNGREAPILLEHNGARVTGAHPPISMANSFGVIDKPFAVRKTSGSPSCDLQTVWGMLKAEGIMYDTQKKSGVFPMVWLEGSGFFFIVGDSEQEVMKTMDEAIELTTKNGYITD